MQWEKRSKKIQFLWKKVQRVAETVENLIKDGGVMYTVRC